MTVLWFILGIVLILGIARYNESNKLFWILLFSFIMGFAGTKMIIDHHGDEQGDGNLTQVCSTYVPTTSMGACMYYIANNMPKVENVVTALQHAGQSSIPALSEIDATLSEVFGRTRDQPLLVLIQPPELCLRKDFSTLHDTG